MKPPAKNDDGFSLRARYFGMVFLALVVAVPILLLGYLTINRAELRAEIEVRHGNSRVARAVAGHVAEYVDAERQLVSSIGEVVAQIPDADTRQAILDSFLVKHRHLRRVSVWNLKGVNLAGDPKLRVNLSDALANHEALDAKVRHAAGAALGVTITFSEPVVVAGQHRGAIVAEVDLVGLWDPINDVKIGRSGFVRLLTTGGELIAHGDPEERRDVFNPATEVSAKLLAGALLDAIVPNRQGEAVIATLAMVPSLDALVMVEQPASEAYEAVAAMRIRLIVLALIVLAAALILGFVFGSQIVKALEKLRRHTAVLGLGDLEARIDIRPDTQIKEIRDLADSVNEMAADLLEHKLEAESRERLVAFSRVAAGLAHDLRHPLESIHAALDTYVQDPGSEDAHEFLAQVHDRDVPRLGRFMDDLRRLARTGSLELELEERDALELAAAVKSQLERMPRYRGMVVFEAEGEAIPLVSDADLVQRALYNLAKNAAEACMERGPGGRVSLRAGPDPRNDGWVRFEVSDTGVGMPEQQLKTVLSSDFRSTKRSTGVGLGLGVVRQVAHSHGGTVTVESKVGEGSTFSLIVPGKAAPPTEGRGDEQAVEANQP